MSVSMMGAKFFGNMHLTNHPSSSLFLGFTPPLTPLELLIDYRRRRHCLADRIFGSHWPEGERFHVANVLLFLDLNNLSIMITL